MIRRRCSHSLAFAFVLVLAAGIPLRAQLILPDKGESLPTFEVATIKPSRSDLGRSFHTHIWWNDNSYSTENLTLRDFVRTAFNAGSSAQLIGGPDSLLDSRFDVSAKIGDEDFAALRKLPRAQRERQTHLMMQALLAERFGLKYHIETRTLPVFELAIDKGGAKLQPWAQPSPSPARAADPPAVHAASKPSQLSQGSRVSIGRDEGSITSTGEPVEGLIMTLTRQPEVDGRLVIDKTGLTGLYSFTLNWSPQRLNAAASPDPTGPSLFTALREQLGLRLEPAKAPVAIVVIDAVSPPSPN